MKALRTVGLFCLTIGMGASMEAVAQVSLVPQWKETRFRRLLPEVDDKETQAMLKDPRLIFYTEEEMPKAYQHFSGSLQGVHLASYNISADNAEPHGNANIEFPWGSPAGMHRTRGTSTFRFLYLPQDEDGNTLPVVWYRQRHWGDSSVGYGWRFPVGAVVGEALVTRSPKGYGYVFELRLRKREVGDWGVDVFRPFPTAESLAERIRELRPDWADSPKLTSLVGQLEEPVDLRRRVLNDNQPGARVFRQTAGVESLPSLGDDKLVAQLLGSTPFTSVLGETWRRDRQGDLTFAATTQAKFHIVPANYDGGFVRVDRESCMRCHETVGQRVDRFNYYRDWYGRVRGSDGIFSFHPFEPSSLSGNGFSGGVRIRQALVRGGALAQYDPRQHPRSLYHSVDRLPH